MKLLFFIDSMLGGGAERVMSIIVNKLTERGHVVYLVTRKPIVYELHEKINIIDSQITYNSNAFVNNVKYIRRVRSIAKETKPDIIISFLWELNAVVLIATLGLSIPVIVSEHTTFDKAKSLFEKIARLYMNRMADKVTILTQADFNYLGNKIPNKIVMPNPLTYNSYIGKTKRKENVIAMGSVNRWHIKGFDNLIRVWAQVVTKYPNWTLDIVGGGNDENMDYLKKLTVEHDVVNSVNFLGFRKDVVEIMQQSAIFVLSSRYEGLGMVLMEAMSQGCACVSFDCRNGPREIIRHNISGLLVKDQDLEEMTNTLMKLIGSETLRKQLSKEAVKDVKKFDADIIVDKWEKLFLELKK